MGISQKIIVRRSDEINNSNACPVQKKDRDRSISLSLDRVLYFNRTISNQAIQRLHKAGVLQAKSTIGHPNDQHDQETDCINEQLIRMPSPQVLQQPEKEDDETVQAKPSDKAAIQRKTDDYVEEASKDFESNSRTIQRQDDRDNPDQEKPSVPPKPNKEEKDKVKSKNKAAEKGGNVCLTFDDGPNAGSKDVLDVLGQTIPATFFLIGNQITGQNVDLVKDMITRKNVQIGNHTFTHYPLKYSQYRKEFGDLTSNEQIEKFKYWFQQNSNRLSELGIKVKLARLPGGGPKYPKPEKPIKKDFKIPAEYNNALKKYEKRLKIYQFYKKLYKRVLDVLKDDKFGLGLTHVAWDSEFTTHETPGLRHVKYRNWQGISEVRCEHKGIPSGILLFHDIHWAGKKDRLDKIVKRLSENRSLGQLNDKGECE